MLSSHDVYCHICRHPNIRGMDLCEECGHSLVQQQAKVDPILGASLDQLEPRQPECLGPTTSVAETLSRLKGKNVGCVLITGDAGELIGIFTERDVLYKVAGLIVKTEALPIESLMTSRPTALPLRATVAHALHLMSIHGFRHIPLVDEENRPVGFISFRDIVRYLGDRYTAA